MEAGPDQAPIGFARHTATCLAAAAIGATAYAAVYLLQCAWAGKITAGLAMLPILWVGAFAIATVSGGFWLTMVWPVTRRPGSAAGLIAPVAVAAGAVMMNASVAIALGKPAVAFNLATFAVLGAVVGFAYGRTVRRV